MCAVSLLGKGKVSFAAFFETFRKSLMFLEKKDRNEMMMTFRADHFILFKGKIRLLLSQ
jgi:hypothetical protein